MSYSLHSLRGGSIGHYTGEYYRGYGSLGDYLGEYYRGYQGRYLEFRR